MNRLIFIAILALSTINTVTYAEKKDKVYTFGVVPQFEARRIYSIWQPILNLLEKESGYKFKIHTPTSIPKFEQELIEGKFDFAYMNPYHMLIANDSAGYIPLVRDHGKKLYGVLVVKNDSDITSPAQLNGKTLAFPSPNALGASLQMRQELHDKFDIEFKSNYVKTHDSVYLNVILGEASAGGGVQESLNAQKLQYKDMLRVIHKTQGVEPHPIAVLAKIPVEVRDRIRDVLLEMGQSKEGKELLSKIPMNRIGPASMDDYLPLKEMNLKRFYVAP
jgi:phosphonate transport system substrate-binding protein